MENNLCNHRTDEKISHTASAQFVFSFASKPIVAKGIDIPLMSDAGLLPLRQLEHRLGLSNDLSTCFTSPKIAAMKHSLSTVLRQRILGICAGWEDANDHDDLRLNTGWQLLVKGNTQALASQPTISRVENALEWSDFDSMAQVVAKFGVRQVKQAYRNELPSELLLDLDSTDDPTHGHQQFSLFHGYYEQTQYQVLCVSEPKSKSVLSSCLLAGTATPAKCAMPDLERIAKLFPASKIHMRADAGFACGAFLCQLESAGMGYTMRLTRNPVLEKLAQTDSEVVQSAHGLSGQTQVCFSFTKYKAESWEAPRTVIYRVESGEKEAHTCFLVTSREITSHEKVKQEFEKYSERGAFEHRFDELKNDLSMDRLSCHRWRANALRVVLHILSYGLTNMLRLLDGIPKWLKVARVKNWIQKVFKAAAHIQVSTRRAVINFDVNWPGWSDFTKVCAAALTAKFAFD